jgi:mono/diheme cytochrome c family protein
MNMDAFMKLRYLLLIGVIASALTACNFSLAADVTPPPDYVPPTPMPTLGPLYPAQAPSLENGAAIYAEKCAACHGETGLGDGPSGKQLPVTVAAFALPETARKASPAQWFTTVSQGNLDRFMPPFISLSGQERWDVVSYAFSLHTTPEQLEQGKSLFEANCPDCTDKFSSQEKMAALSETDLVRIIKEGDSDIPAFGSSFTEDEAWAVAAYLRSLTFAAPPASIPATASLTEAPTTPAVEGTPLEGTAQVQVTPEAPSMEGVGIIIGSIDNQTGSTLPSDLKVTLRGFEHGSDPNTGPQEILTLEGHLSPGGTYRFENVEIPENRIFLAETTLDGVPYQSEFAVVEAGMTEVVLPPIVVYATTEDFSVLQVDSLQLFFDLASPDNAQVFAVYTITNTSNKAVHVKVASGEEVPFISYPAGSTGLGYEATQDSATFLPTEDGFVMPPSDTTYGLIAFASLPRDKEIEIVQTTVLPIAEVTLYLPEGVKAVGEGLSDAGIRMIQDTNFHIYTSGSLSSGASLTFTISGKPKGTTTAAALTQNQTLLIGVGVLGLVLILAGVWLYLRDRKRFEEDPDEDDDLDSSESIMDAVIALDDLHRAGKIPEEAYHQRRAELMDRLKEKV